MSKNHYYLLITITIISSFAQTRNQNDIKHTPFLRPLLSSDDPVEIHKQYANFFLVNFQYEILKQSNHRSIIEQLLKINVDNLPRILKTCTTSEAKIFTEATFNRYFLSNVNVDNNSIKSVLENILIAFIICHAQETKIKTADFNELFPDSILEEVLSKFDNNRKTLKNDQNAWKNLKEFIMDQKRSFLADRTIDYNKFATFNENRVFYMCEFANFLTQNVCKIKNQVNQSILTQINSIWATLLYEIGPTILHEVGISLIDDYFVNANANSLTIVSVLQDLITNIANYQFDKNSYKYSLSLFVNFFYPEIHHLENNFSSEYRNFILRKYNKDKIFVLSNSHLENMSVETQLFIIELLTIAFKVNVNLIQASDIKIMLSQFSIIANKFNFRHLYNYREAKTLVFQYKQYLKPYFTLFNDMFNSILLFSEWRELTDAKYKKQHIIDDLSNYFDISIEKIEDQTELNFCGCFCDGENTTKAKPNLKIAEKIQNNYFFYKLVILLIKQNLEQPKGLVFKKFESDNDIEIHMFTKESKIKQLLMYYKEKLVLGSGFNYKIFSKASISAERIVRSRQYFEKRAKRIEENGLEVHEYSF